MAVLGAVGQAVINEIVFSRTIAWACPMDCRVIVTVIGGGGAGGASYAPTAGHCILAGGGGAGGVAKSLLTLASGTSYTSTIGAGGASVAGQTTGTTGGNSTFGVTGATVLMTANGGVGGAYAANTSADSAAGGAGGAATSDGNIFNAAGGAGGTAALDATGADLTSYHVFSCGGGAPGIFGVGHRGGNATSTVGGYNKTGCSGGAGVNGEGGDVVIPSTTTAVQVTSQGGTMFGKGYDVTATAHAYPAAGTLGYRQPTDSRPYNFNFRGMYSSAYRQPDGNDEQDMVNTFQGQTTSIFDGLLGSPEVRTLNNQKSNAGPGAGGVGYAWGPGTDTNGVSMGGLFGAGGGNGNYTASGVTYGSTGSFGCGGGGAAAYTSSSPYTASGGGGRGLVVISIVEMF